MNVLFATYAFLFGLIIGSFLNVVIARFRTGMSLSGRSRCFSCGKTLSWYELIPLLSFIFQRGRCRVCHTRISWRYPLVELLGGFAFPLVFLKVGVGTPSALLYGFVIASLLIAIAVYDVRHKIIPDLFVYLLSIFALGGIVWQHSLTLPTLATLWHVLAGPLLFLPFALMWFFSRGTWIGFGDAKLAWGIGWLLGLSKGIVAILFSFWIGAVVSIGAIAISKSHGLFSTHKRFTMKSEIPFGPFLVLGLGLVWFWGIDTTTLLSFFVW